MTVPTRAADDEGDSPPVGHAPGFDAEAGPEVGPEVSPEVGTVEPSSFESFVHAVRAMVHGEAVDVADLAQPAGEVLDGLPPAALLDPDPAGDGTDAWLPGTWLADAPAAKHGRRAARRIPDQARGDEFPAVATTGSDPVSGSTRGRRRERHRDAVRAAASSTSPEGDEPVMAGAPSPTEEHQSPRRARRRARRVAAARAVADAVPVGGPGGPGGPPTDPSDPVAGDAPSGPAHDDPAPPTEASGAPRRGRPLLRRAVRAGAVAALVGGALVVPWMAPEVPQHLADLVPGHASAPVHVQDPTVAPPTDAVVGPVGVDQQAGPYDGVRLQSAGRPRQVQVSRLHVDSAVVPISGQSGSLLPPSDPRLLGWWQEGQPVGSESGTAVITGHTVHTGGGALDHLDRLVVGDSIRVRTDAGWIKYVVQRTQVYSTAQLARSASDLFRQDGIGRLVLITCDNWNGRFYESNALVVASPVQDQPLGG